MHTTSDEDTVLPALELETNPNPSASVIWLHGLGADGNDFVPIVKELALPKQWAIRFVFPHAPTRPVTINGGMVLRAWYDIFSADLSERSDEEGIRSSQALLEGLIARERSRGQASSRIVLAGFSQGGVIALQTALRYPERLAGVIALSTYLAMPHQLTQEASAANQKLPIFMGHGRADLVIPLQLGEFSHKFLDQHGYRTDWHTYAMPHSVCWEEIQDISQWLQMVLKGAQS